MTKHKFVKALMRYDYAFFCLIKLFKLYTKLILFLNELKLIRLIKDCQYYKNFMKIMSRINK